MVLFKFFDVFHFCLNSLRQQLKGAHPRGGGGVSYHLKVAFIRKKPYHRCSCIYVHRYAYILISYKYRTVKLQESIATKNRITEKSKSDKKHRICFFQIICLKMAKSSSTTNTKSFKSTGYIIASIWRSKSTLNFLSSWA